MVVRIIAVLLMIGLLTIAGTAILGRLWRLVLLRPQNPDDPRSLHERLVVIAPGHHEFQEQQANLARFDLPVAGIFLAGSLLFLAMQGSGVAWLVVYLIWCGGAVARWLTRSARAVMIRSAIVVLLVFEALLVLGIRGGDALPHALLYLATALVGALVLYRANELPFTSSPGGPGMPPPRRSPRPPGLPEAPYPDYMMHHDTVPASQPPRPLARVTPIRYARRNPLRVREDEGAVLTPPYYMSGQ